MSSSVGTGHRLLRNILRAPQARLLSEERLANGGYVAALEVEGLLCEYL